MRDAACATLRLGLRFLWVDRYCIDQLNPDERAQTIRHMDTIYRCADLVICAAAGHGADSGLPGVSSSHRIRQPICTLEKYELRSTFPSARWAICDSLWNSRGWTLQEARLARRCLFFTQYQMYFVCHTGTRSEAMPYENSFNALEYHMNDCALNSAMFANIVHRNNRGHDMFLDRQMFSLRTLTYDSDALDAMKGILLTSPFTSLWGVPIKPSLSPIDPSLGMALGLLWYRDLSVYRFGYSHAGYIASVHSKRRENYPTWSWASITGVIASLSAEELSSLGMFQSNNPKLRSEDIGSTFSVKISNSPDLGPNDPESFISLRQAVRECGSRLLPEYSRAIWVEADYIEVELSVRRHLKYAEDQYTHRIIRFAGSRQGKTVGYVVNVDLHFDLDIADYGSGTDSDNDSNEEEETEDGRTDSNADDAVANDISGSADEDLAEVEAQDKDGSEGDLTRLGTRFDGMNLVAEEEDEVVVVVVEEEEEEEEEEEGPHSGSNQVREGQQRSRRIRQGDWRTLKALILLEEHDTGNRTVNIHCMVVKRVSEDVYERRGLLRGHGIVNPAFRVLEKRRRALWLR